MTGQAGTTTSANGHGDAEAARRSVFGGGPDELPPEDDAAGGGGLLERFFARIDALARAHRLEAA